MAENGAIFFDPRSRRNRALCQPPPHALVESLRQRGVTPLEIGQVIVATDTVHHREVQARSRRSACRSTSFSIRTRLMILPRGVDKATGLAAALAELNLSPTETVAVGDAENDAAMLAACGQGVAVANGLPASKRQPIGSLRSAAGQGVIELVERLLARGDLRLETWGLR